MLKIYKERPEILGLVTKLCQEDALKSLSDSYVSALAHAISKMSIDDEVSWFSLASHIS